MKKLVYRLLLPISVCMIIQIIVFVLMQGIPLWGLPEASDVIRVEITHSILHSQPKVFSEEQDLKNAVNVSKFLNCGLKGSREEEPLITITYYLRNGKTEILAAGENTVYWKGKARSIYGDNGNMFRSISETLFFIDDIMDAEIGE